MIGVNCFSRGCSLDELVQDGVNGVVFDTAAELCQHFQRLLAGFPSESAELDKYRDKLREFRYSDVVFLLIAVVLTPSRSGGSHGIMFDPCSMLSQHLRRIWGPLQSQCFRAFE